MFYFCKKQELFNGLNSKGTLRLCAKILLFCTKLQPLVIYWKKKEKNGPKNCKSTMTLLSLLPTNILC